MGEPKNPKLKKLLNKTVKNKLKKITPSQAEVLKTKAKTEERTLRKEARINSAIEQQMKVPGYAQTKASKKAMAGRMIAREHKIPLSAPFKSVDDQRKVISTIKANVQIKELNKTLLETKKDTNYKTPPALSKKMAFKRKHTLLPDTRYPYTMGKTKSGKLHNLGSPEYKKLQEYKGKTRVGYTAPGKLNKVPVLKILKEPNVKEYAQNVKSYVKQKGAYEWKQAQNEMKKPVPSGYGSKKNPNKKERELEKRFQQHKSIVRQEKAAGRLGTKMRQIIKGFNKPKRGGGK